MDVHVPEPGDQIFSGSIDYVSLLESAKTAFADVRDSVALDNHGCVRSQSAARGVDHRDIGDGIGNTGVYEKLSSLRNSEHQPHQNRKVKVFHRLPQADVIVPAQLKSGFNKLLFAFRF